VARKPSDAMPADALSTRLSTKLDSRFRIGGCKRRRKAFTRLALDNEDCSIKLVIALIPASTAPHALKARDCPLPRLVQLLQLAVRGVRLGIIELTLQRLKHLLRVAKSPNHQSEHVL